jgi:DNA-binding HxlR family transcriptional regulator
LVIARRAQNAEVPAQDEYCHFTKAVENLGDRWSLMVLGELERKGTLGFNALAGCIPGISRSILADRLRRLEQLSLITRDPSVRKGVPGYCVTPAGAQLKPVFMALKNWALRWVPEDPAIAERDPDVIVWWLRHRLEADCLPDRQVVLALDVRGARANRTWIVLDPGKDPSFCDEDPLLADDRYVFVEADAADIYPIAKGIRTWREAIRDGSVQLFGDPTLVRALPSWFGELASPARRDRLDGRRVAIA